MLSNGVKRRSPYDDNDTALCAPVAGHRVAYPWYRLQLRALEELIPPRIGQRQEPQQRVEEAHELVARSKGLTTHVIPPFPVSSEAEESNMNAPTFAEQSAEEEGEEPVTMSNVEAERLEAEELDVDYTMEVIDEEKSFVRSWSGKLIAALSSLLRAFFPVIFFA